MGGKIEELTRDVRKFNSELEQCPHDRYLSWEHCYETFHHERMKSVPDIERLCLHLAFYLASWGMYRGSSFLLQRDYLIHTEPIKILLKEKYECLWGISAEKLCDLKVCERVFDLVKELSRFYEHVRDEVRRSVGKKTVKMDVSSTLITKILMGTMGCSPAFDRYFKDGLKAWDMCQSFSLNSLSAMAKFYVGNADAFAAVGRITKDSHLPYPEMKILDMAFWKCGFDHPNGK